VKRCQDNNLVFDIDFPVEARIGERDSWSVVDDDIVSAIDSMSTLYTPRLPVSPDNPTSLPTFPGETLWAFASATKLKGLHKIRPAPDIAPAHFTYESVSSFGFDNPFQKVGEPGKIVIVCEFSIFHSQPPFSPFPTRPSILWDMSWQHHVNPYLQPWSC